VNIVRDIGKIFEFLVNVDDVSEWINLYAPIYYGVNTINGVNNMIFEEKYSIFAKRAAREIVIEKSEKPRRRKKRNRIT
jgi:uncharacterized protein YegJ (DUF2314 family)